MSKNDRDDIDTKGKIKVWMMFEVQAANEKTAKEAMNKHIKSLKDEKGIEVIEEAEDDVIEIDAPEHLKERGIEKLYSYIYEVVILSPRFDDIVQAVINYAPSTIEVLEPNNINIKMGDMQNALNSIADMLHKILSHGLGGMVIKR